MEESLQSGTGVYFYTSNLDLLVAFQGSWD